MPEQQIVEDAIAMERHARMNNKMLEMPNQCDCWDCQTKWNIGVAKVMD